MRARSAANNRVPSPAATPLTPAELRLIDGYWRASNYLAVGQIYLLDNPLLKQPLKLEHVKPRLLGHWGTTPGLNFIYVHLNRVIRQLGLDMLYITDPVTADQRSSRRRTWRAPTASFTRTCRRMNAA